MDRKQFIVNTVRAGGLVIGGPVLAACGADSGGGGASSAKAGKEFSVMVGSADIAWAPVQLADVAGYYKRNGLHVKTLLQGSGGATANYAAVRKGDVSAGGSTGGGVVGVAAQSGDVKLFGVLTGFVNVTIVVRPDVLKKAGITQASPIADRVRALKGLRVGSVTIGGGDYFALQLIMKQFSLSITKDVKVTTLTPQESIVTALDAGHLDAANLVTPWGEYAEIKGSGVPILSTAQPAVQSAVPGLSGLVFTCIYGQSSLLSDPPRKDAMQRFMTSIATAQRLLQEKPDRARQLLLPLYKSIPQAVITKALSTDRQWFMPTPEIGADRYAVTHDYEVKALGKSINLSYEAAVDTTLAKAATTAARAAKL